MKYLPTNSCEEPNHRRSLPSPRIIPPPVPSLYVRQLILPLGLTDQKQTRTIVPMKITADTNTFLAVALNEPEKHRIIRLTEGHDLIAPDVLPFEVGNALTAMLKKGALKKEEVALAWDAVQQIPVDLRHTDIKSALKLAIEHNIYAYDAYFLECADNLRSPLLTLDLGMKRVAREIGITILE